MYLKSIRAYGFKSFADKVDIELKPGITGVVGPNGSGKSNIVDAVRWVLGEQSAKALRAEDGMKDVIFAGSKTRPAHTRASVSLTFDNTDHYLNSEFSEIEVKRVVYLTGENEYYINNTKVRLKDITDLFLDSGASKESFNIISQGSIMDIVNSKPEDRRTIFEEAASVLKYKKRKEESLRKMEKTRDNMERVDLIIRELEESLNPLKEQKEKAEEYQSYKAELESTEIALIAHDIEALNRDYEQAKSEKERITQSLEEMDTTSTEDIAKVEKLKLALVKLEEEITAKNETLIALSKTIADLNSEKQIMLERKKFEADDMKLQTSLVALKEEALVLEKNIKGLEDDLAHLKKECQELEKKRESLLSKQNECNIKRSNLAYDQSKKEHQIYEYQNKIRILEDNIESDAKVPYAVKSIINHPRLTGVHGYIGKLIEVEDTYATAIETALGFSANVIVVDDEKVAKNCITYLKENRLGRATFFPLNVIESKRVDVQTQKVAEASTGYVGIASELVTFQETYRNIIENQLGNVIVVKDMDALNDMGRKINYRYRVVSLDGEILHTGGSITGGAVKNTSGLFTQKKELEQTKDALKTIQQEVETQNEKLESYRKELEKLEEEITENNRSLIAMKENIHRKEITKQDLTESYEAKNRELEGTKSASTNHLDESINALLEDFYQKTAQKETIEKEIAHLKNDKVDLNNEIETLEKSYREANSAYNRKQNELKAVEISLGKLDVKLDNMLLILNEEYKMTYEHAKEHYELTIDPELARESVSKVKSKIKALGEVNLGAIAEYERIHKRYTFLDSQKKDLEASLQNLTEIIAEMDDIMKERFLETFEKIKKEFQIVFKKLFKGGEGILKLTDPDNILETGIEIIAQPPGKKLNSITLLSGGEKTLTAISLLFAILNVKPVPFCILDEVEAALDEANVDTFGMYLKEKQDRSQFIIITHKKRTMEYADVLYGITMQESGVSKMVSVRLEDIK